MRVACLGDSITRGDARHEPGRGTHPPYKHQTAGRGSYPARLQELLGGSDDLLTFAESAFTFEYAECGGATLTNCELLDGAQDQRPHPRPMRSECGAF